MNLRYGAMFTRLAQMEEGAFVPFVVLGDPSPEISLQVIDALIAGGADALELGIPFSDPLADGPTIQNATLRALSTGVTPDNCLAMVATIRQKYPHLPIGLLLYANLVMAPGIDEFYEKCANTGVDSVLVADVPIEMSTSFANAAQKHGVASIFIAPPNADDATLKAIAAQGDGYTYLLSRSGVTGAEKEAGMPIERLIASLQRHNAAPALLGFGISRPDQVAAAIGAGAAGVISGSAVIKIMEKHLNKVGPMLADLTAYVASMKAATRKPVMPSRKAGQGQVHA